MRSMAFALSLTVLLAIAGRASSEDAASGDTVRTWGDTELSKVDEVLKLIRLPEIAEKTRDSGVSREDVRTILDEAVRRKLPPAETETILQESGRAAREYGPVDNFGAFVQSKLNEGLRGRDLASAIHEEHRLRGKGHLKDKKAGKGNSVGQGKVKPHPNGKSIDSNEKGDSDANEHRDEDASPEKHRKNREGDKK